MVVVIKAVEGECLVFHLFLGGGGEVVCFV